MTTQSWRCCGDGILLAVRLTPGAAKDRIETPQELAGGKWALKARVRAVPEKGKANAALTALIAGWLDVPKTDVSVTSGLGSRLKTVHVMGDPDRLSARLNNLLND